jgi:hypothetical protein
MDKEEYDAESYGSEDSGTEDPEREEAIQLNTLLKKKWNIGEPD